LVLQCHASQQGLTTRTPPIDPLNEWTATEIVAAIESGNATCEAVVRACLDRIAAREPDVQAWAYIDPEAALSAARAFDKGGRRGPIAGVPFGVKDIVDTFDMPTEWGTPIHKGRQPERDAACVALSRKAGGLLLGKTVTTEFANLHPGPTRNPHDLTRTPGGSSSGSAAAVADFMVPIAIGTQTTGSTIRPASFCGVFGYRPTYGEHRLHGVMEASGSLDTLGILSRSVEDIALYRDVLLGIPPEPIVKIDQPPRIGLCRTHVWDQMEPNTRTLLEDAALRLARAGAHVRDVSLPAGFERLNDAHRWISSFEFARTFTYEIEKHWDKISDTLRGGRLNDGINGSFERYIAAKQTAEQCRRQLDDVFGDYDVLLTPSAFGEAPVGMFAFAGVPLFQIWTALHVPAVSLPVFKGPNGLPIGAQLLAKRHNDRKLFSCARWAWQKLM
jgi:Asp-tRNA(Asn)/Glu-tRNA(Gln) amidotransferase A subunit family amidase